MIFTNVIKPTHLCNLACKYCYNDDLRKPVMDEVTLEQTIKQTFLYAKNNHSNRSINFIWHGGEPMLAGIGFFEQAIFYQKKYCEGFPYTNLIQTNGLLVLKNEKWATFFKDHDFSVSISIDGPREVHDTLRVDHRGIGSFDKVDAAISKFQNIGLPVGVCVVVSKANAHYLNDVYEYLVDKKIGFNVIPIMKSGGARNCYDIYGLGPDEYADYWIPLYDRWFDADQDYVYCSDFVFKTRAIVAGRPADCIGLEQCAETNISVDPIGDVYPCASVSGHADKKYGNLLSESLEDIMNTDIAHDHKERRVDPQCAVCKWQHVCHGGCPARSYKFFNDHHQRDYYCPSLFRMYEHIEKRLKHKFEELKSTNLNTEVSYAQKS